MLRATSAHLKSLGITRPTALLDEERARANIRAMAAKARRSRTAFRPHFKTHQSPTVGRWFAEEDTERITVSSVPMAERFAEIGWRDITVAFLLNPLEIPRIAELAAYLHRHGGRLGLTVDSVAAARSAAGLDVDLWVKVDTGYGRTGVPWDAPDRLRGVLAAIDEPTGLLTHAGHSYLVRGSDDLAALFDETVDRLTAARAAGGAPGLKLSVGDTPCCSVVADFAGIDEVRPGNFVFYDLMQLEIGSCRADRLAAAAACPVVGIYPERGQIVVHGGAVHLSKEGLESGGRRIYGRLGTLDLLPQGRRTGLGGIAPEAAVISLSQEHGVVRLPPAMIAGLEIGDLVLVWPVHSCLMCDLMRDPVIL